MESGYYYMDWDQNIVAWAEEKNEILTNKNHGARIKLLNGLNDCRAQCAEKKHPKHFKC